VQSANQLTHRTLDPRSNIPEYKVSACRLEKAVGPPPGWPPPPDRSKGKLLHVVGRT
jgi:assimilatory nitrate reductase catalytic subunit